MKYGAEEAKRKMDRGYGKKTVMGGKEEEDETGGGVRVGERRCRGQGNVAEKG